MSSNKATITKILEIVKDHFADNKDNYYVLYDTPSNKFVILHTGYGSSNLKTLPIGKNITTLDSNCISSAGIGLYGTLGQKGKARLALYLRLDNTIINSYSFKNEI